MDQGIKRLIQTHPADVLDLLVPGAEYLGTLPVDVASEPQLVLDMLLGVRYHGIECALDIEAEARPRPEIGKRLCDYGSRVRGVTGLRVISAVLWLEPGGTPPPSPYEERADDLPLVSWHFIGVELYRVQAPALIARGPVGLLPLVPFAQGGDDLATVERTAALVKERAPAAEVDELAGLLALFAARTFDAEVLRGIMRRLKMSTEIIEKSAFYQEALAKGEAKGKAEGIEEGQRNAALVVLRGRFGELPPDLAQAISAADQATLDQVLRYAGTDTLEQVRARLGV